MNANKLATAINLLIKDKHKDADEDGMLQINLPIEIIDGIRGIQSCLKIYIGKIGCGTIILEIDMDCLMDENADYKNIYRIARAIGKGKPSNERILEICKEILEIIPKLKLQKNGMLDIVDNTTASIQKAVREAFESIECENVKMHKYLECCVCKEETDTHTPCNHELCYRCWSNIKVIKDDDGDDIMPCPLCRQHIHCE